MLWVQINLYEDVLFFLCIMLVLLTMIEGPTLYACSWLWYYDWYIKYMLWCLWYHDRITKYLWGYGDLHLHCTSWLRLTLWVKCYVNISMFLVIGNDHRNVCVEMKNCIYESLVVLRWCSTINGKIFTHCTKYHFRVSLGR